MTAEQTTAAQLALLRDTQTALNIALRNLTTLIDTTDAALKGYKLDYEPQPESLPPGQSSDPCKEFWEKYWKGNGPKFQEIDWKAKHHHPNGCDGGCGRTEFVPWFWGGHIFCEACKEVYRKSGMPEKPSPLPLEAREEGLRVETSLQDMRIATMPIGQDEGGAD